MELRIESLGEQHQKEMDEYNGIFLFVAMVQVFLINIGN